MIKIDKFDEKYLECSWEWLNDPEIRLLTMTPKFSKREQQKWFKALPASNYKIWGISIDNTPIGAIGLKNLTAEVGEYWGYIGEKKYWGQGLGSEMLSYIVSESKRLGLKRLTLCVDSKNQRAIKCYLRFGFKETIDSKDGNVVMKIDL